MIKIKKIIKILVIKKVNEQNIFYKLMNLNNNKNKIILIILQINQKKNIKFHNKINKIN